jgi:N-carbamoyl-L-amino-acid hydrolase|tara:strand:+ start:3378 stop:4622 length:1245 start_codon:yes stop_codon:yes gene_type:complete
MNSYKYATYLFNKIKKLTFSDPGVTRATYGKGENLTHKFLINELKNYTNDIFIDYGGNFLATYMRDKKNKLIIIGSHLDSQKHGGNFDGLAGVIMGICLLKILKEKNIFPKYNIGVMGIRGEESCWFPYSYIGSKIALGLFEKQLLKKLKRSDTGKSLSYHINKSGFNAKAVAAKKTELDCKNIIAFIEPHIEQGPVLENIKIPLGIVTGIRGSFRFRNARCIGKYLHSGATPIDYRQDAVVAVSKLVTDMNNLWKKELKNKKDLTITFGQFYTDNEEHSFAKSSGLVNFCIDVRSNSRKTLHKVKKLFFRQIKKIENITNTKFDLGEETNSEPALMNNKLINKFIVAAKKSKVKSIVMASGAGHDASVFANNDIPSIMLFIRNKHGSHNPKEYMSINHFVEVLKVLETSIINF